MAEGRRAAVDWAAVCVCVWLLRGCCVVFGVSHKPGNLCVAQAVQRAVVVAAVLSGENERLAVVL